MTERPWIQYRKYRWPSSGEVRVVASVIVLGDVVNGGGRSPEEARTAVVRCLEARAAAYRLALDAAATDAVPLLADIEYT